MEIIHNTNNPHFSLSSIRGGKRNADGLQSNEKDLLEQMAEAFNIVHGGQFKRRKQTA